MESQSLEKHLINKIFQLVTETDIPAGKDCRDPIKKQPRLAIAATDTPLNFLLILWQQSGN
jgi:hypothetical protein